MNGEDLRALAERSWALEDNTPARLGDVRVRIAAARRRRRSLALGSVAGALVVVALTLVLIRTDPNGGTPDPAPSPSPSLSRDPTPAPSTAEHRPAEGTCWAVPAEAVLDGSVRNDDSPQVPCGQEHTTETVAVLALPEPTAQEAEKRAVDICWEYVRQYVGADRRNWIPWGMVPLLPSEEQISDGASWIRCDAAFPDGRDWASARTTTGSAEGLADDPPPELWACFDTRPSTDHPAVPCDGPHAYEQTGRVAVITGLDSYPDERKRESVAVQCEAGIPLRLQGFPVYIAWDPPSAFDPDHDVTGICFVHDPDGSLPARPPSEGQRS